MDATERSRRIEATVDRLTAELQQEEPRVAAAALALLVAALLENGTLTEAIWDEALRAAGAALRARPSGV